MASIYRYIFKGGRNKITCPSCGKRSAFSRIWDRKEECYLDPEKYGKCDRENNCEFGLGTYPEKEFIDSNDVKEPIDLEEKNLYESDTILETEHFYDMEGKPYKWQPLKNHFLVALRHRFGKELVDEAKHKYRLGTFYDGAVVYPYYFRGVLHTGKIMFYKGLNRDKNPQKHPMWLHSYSYKNYFGYSCVSNYEGHKPNYPLFGWDLIKDDDFKIGLVESEKTAVIMSMFIPEIPWVATGALSWMQPYRFPYHLNKVWLMFPDLGIKNIKTGETNADYWVAKIKKIPGMMATFPNFLPELSEEEHKEAVANGSDIADFIINKGNDYINFIRTELNLKTIKNEEKRI